MKMTNNSLAPTVPFRRSLYTRLALAFLLITVAVGLTHIYITSLVYRPLVAHIEQQVHWDLAANLAEALHPTLVEEFDRERIEEVLFNYLRMNPKVEAYILDSDGIILAEMALNGSRRIVDRVPLEPIEQVLEAQSPVWPIFGRDPRASEEASNGPNRAISVAPISLNGQSGYLYLVLEAKTFRFLTRATGQFYIITTVLIAMLAAIALASIAGFVVFMYLTRSFRTLSAAVTAYRDGVINVHIPVTTDDEVGRLSAAVNDMIETISRQTEELKSNDRLRREFIANISHDLRSPLASMQGFLETLNRKRGIATASEREHYLDMIAESVRLQRQLVDDLFELSKLDAKERLPELEPAHPGEIAQDVLVKHKAAADSKNLKLKFDVSGRCPLVATDIVLLDRTLSNLVSNAIRYTPEGGTITLSVQATPQGCELRVSDTGIGIPESELPHIFESFYRVDKDRNQKTGGSGLGLAIVKRIIELHGSEIFVESTEAEGTSFWFRLTACQSQDESTNESVGSSDFRS